MRRSLFLLCVAACGGSTASAPAPAPAPTPIPAPTPGPPKTMTLSIVGTNDLHGQFRPEPSGERGGLAIFAGYLANLRAARAADGGGVVLLDGGDAFQGTLESNMNEGAVVISAYNALGYDAMAMGNHEYDYGPVGPAVTPRAPGDDPRGAIKARAAEAKFPILTANTFDKETQAPVNWPNVQPSVMLERSGVKIGVIGLSTLDTPFSTMTANVVGLDFQGLAATMKREAGVLRARGAQVILVTAHAGGKCKGFDAPKDLSSCDPNEEMFRALAELPPGLIDVVVGGHTHDGVAHLVNGTAVIESYAYGKAFGRVDLTLEGGKVKDLKIFPPRELCLKVATGTLRCDPKDTTPREPATYEGKPVTAQPAIAAILEPAVEGAASRRAEKLGPKITRAIVKSYGAESPLGNFVADLMHDARPKADVSLTNGGGLRANLEEGDLTYGQFYELYPFDNRYALVKTTGAAFAGMIRQNLLSDKGIVSLGGMRAVAVCKGGDLVVTLRRANGKIVKPTDKILVATSDFLAGGGNDGVGAPTGDPDSVVIEDEIVREALVALIRKRGAVTLDGQDPKLMDPKKPRLVYPGKRPVKCPQ